MANLNTISRVLRTIALVAVAMCISRSVVAKPTAAKSDSVQILADPSWLVGEINAWHIDRHTAAGAKPPPITIDVRSKRAYEAGTIPTARWIDAAEWKAAFGQGDDAEAWTQRIGQILKNKDATVVVFDDRFTPTAARIWWILKYWGVEDVRVLDGGLRGYEQARGPFEVVQGARGGASDFRAKAHPQRLAKYEDVLGIAEGENEACLIDARTGEENTAGHIPSAVHLDWQAMVDAETGKLKSRGELRNLLAQTDFAADSPVVTYCQSGGRASVTAFVVEYLTGKPAANYYSSWGEWTQLRGPESTSEAE